MEREAKRFKDDSEAPIIIKKEPKSAVLENQSEHEFSVEVEWPADAADTLTYEWYFRPQNEPGMQKMESETSTLVIEPLSEEDLGSYFCVISCGSPKRTATTALAKMSGFKKLLSPASTRRSVTLVPPSNNSEIPCAGSEASKDPKAEEIEHALRARPNAKIICESFHELKPDNSNPQDYSEMARGFISATGKSISNSVCLALLFVFHQLMAGLQCCVSLSFPIMRTMGTKGDNYADLAVFKSFRGFPVYPLLLVEVKTKKDESNPLTQYYEICRDEHIPLACAGRARLAHFPCYGLAFNQESKCTTVTLYGFATFVFKGKKETWISEIDSCLVNKVSDVATVGKFLNKIKQRVKELEEIVKIGEMEMWLRVSSSRRPLLPEDVEYRKTLSRSTFLCQHKSDSSHVVVKFLSDCDIKYTTDAQRFMAGEGFAPEILKEKERENIKMVVMKKIEGETLSEWLNWSTSTQLAAKIVSKLQVCLNRLHSGGYIHGDFRGPNVLIEEKSCGDDVVVTIIDFDWSCEETSPNQYPPELNQDLLWPAKKGDLMDQIDDHYHFAQLKAELFEKK